MPSAVTDNSKTKLPEDTETLHQMIYQLMEDVTDLRRQLSYYKRHTFGSKSERIDPAQLQLFEDQLNKKETAIEKLKAYQAKQAEAKPSKRNGRRPLPEDLPKERIEHHPDKEELHCNCCGGEKTPMGEKVTQQLDYVPASFVIREHVRIKYACRKCQGKVSIADLPAMPINKGRPGYGLLAHVLVSKYQDHLPLYRQEGIFDRHGIDINRSTLCDWIKECSWLLSPVVDQLKKEILSSDKIHTDDTKVPVKVKGRKTTKSGYLWVYLGDNKNAVYDYTPDRSREGPVRFLKDFKGYLQADAYSGYNKVFEKGDVTEVACWAHARRKFFDSLETDPLRANIMLELIGRLYKIEKQIREEKLDTSSIEKLRKKESNPILKKIDNYLKQWSDEVLPKSPIGKAVGYARGQWEALNCYTTNGRLDIDNNASERALKSVVIGRKNWMFAGSDKGGEMAAVIYSLVQSCKLIGIDAFKYLRDVLERVNTHPASRIEELTPRRWKELFLPEIEKADSAAPQLQS